MTALGGLIKPRPRVSGPAPAFSLTSLNGCIDLDPRRHGQDLQHRTRTRWRLCLEGPSRRLRGRPRRGAHRRRAGGNRRLARRPRGQRRPRLRGEQRLDRRLRAALDGAGRPGARLEPALVWHFGDWLRPSRSPTRSTPPCSPASARSTDDPPRPPTRSARSCTRSPSGTTSSSAWEPGEEPVHQRHPPARRRERHPQQPPPSPTTSPRVDEAITVRVARHQRSPPRTPRCFAVPIPGLGLGRHDPELLAHLSGLGRVDSCAIAWLGGVRPRGPAGSAAPRQTLPRRGPPPRPARAST